MSRGGSLPPIADKTAIGRQRLDKYLWFARMARTRSAAARLITDGHVRINGRRADQPARMVGPGDVLTLSLERAVRVLRIRDTGARRGPYTEARHLYEEIGGSQPTPKPGQNELAQGELGHDTDDDEP